MLCRAIAVETILARSRSECLQAWLMVTVILAGLILVTDVVRAAGEVSTRIAFEESDVRVRPAGGSYDHVELDGADADVTDSREGEPQLPIIVRFFLLPPGTTVDEVAIQVLDAVTLPGRVRPVPIRPPGTDDYPETPPWDAERTYPSVRAFVVKAGDQRTYRMAKVAYSPLTYDARTQQLTLTTVADITLSLRAMSAVEARRGTVLERPETRDGAWGELRALVRSKVVNGSPHAMALWWGSGIHRKDHDVLRPDLQRAIANDRQGFRCRRRLRPDRSGADRRDRRLLHRTQSIL